MAVDWERGVELGHNLKTLGVQHLSKLRLY